MFLNEDDEKTAKILRDMIIKELDEELEDMDMESEYRNPVHFSLSDITKFATRLRYVRRHLTRANLMALSVHELKMLTEREGFLDTRIPPATAARMLQFDLTTYSTTARANPEGADSPQRPSLLDGVTRNEAAPETTSTPSSKPRVPPARFRAWWEEYRLTRNIDLVPQADMLQAARANFPEHSVPRAMIRECVGSRKRGPKPKLD